MLTRVLIIHFTINIILVTVTTTKVRQHGPGGMEDHEATNCDEFGKYARFNPYSVLDSEWMVFYYWGPTQNALLYTFYVPAEKETVYLKKILNGNVKEPINWTANFVLMKERSNNTSLLVQKNDRGAFHLYRLYALTKDKILEPVDVRIKQTGDNQFIGFMSCETEVVYMMARLKDVPRHKNIQDAAARLGYRGRGGKSYLYQGHQWMPIPEADERLFWSEQKDWHLYY